MRALKIFTVVWTILVVSVGIIFTLFFGGFGGAFYLCVVLWVPIMSWLWLAAWYGHQEEKRQ